MVLVGILSAFHVIIPYSKLQYISSGLLMFVSAEVLEGKILVVIFFSIYVRGRIWVNWASKVHKNNKQFLKYMKFVTLILVIKMLETTNWKKFYIYFRD
jgi:hypothetical protein